MTPYEIFLRLVNSAFAASWLVLAVLALRLILRKAPRHVICLLWAVVAVRLLMPFSIESRMSLVPSARTLPLEGFFAVNRAEFEDPDNWHVDTGFPSLDGEAADKLLLAPTPTHNFFRAEFFSLLWLAGAAGMLIYGLASYGKLRRRVATAVLAEPGVRRSENVEAPFVMGLFRPVIYLPFAMRKEDLPSVLAHERAHIARRDHIWKSLGFLILSIYWFDPLLWLAWILFCRDLELACDEHVTRGMGLADRQSYSEALLNCAVRKNTFMAPLAFGEVGVKRRVEAIMNMKKPAPWLVFLSVLAVAVSAVCFLTDPVRPKPEQDHDTREVYGLAVLEKK